MGSPKPDPVDDPDPLSTPYGSLNDLAPDLATLHDLASRGSWRTLIETVSRARSLSLLTSSHHHLTYLTFNILALTKLRRFSDALTELQTLVDDLDSSEYRYESYPQSYPNLTGSMVPFSLRWLHCLLPIKCGNRTLGLDRFYVLLGFVRAKIEERSMKEESLSGARVSCDVWKRREVFVVNCIVNDHLAHKEFRVCLDLIRDLMVRRESFGFGIDPALLSKLGYIQMQIGDLEGAKGTFDRVERIVSDRDGGGGDLKLLSEVELNNLVNRNKALVYLVGKDYVSAVREYEECIERDNSDVIAINNKALCLMYLRDLSDSIKVLENSLERVPTVALNETLVVNLCSMYELAYVNHSDIKKTLSNWIARVAPDDFDSSCTRV